MKKIVLTGGGTAGHVTPNIALLPRLNEASFQISYIGSLHGIEKELIEAQQIPYYGISSGKLRRYLDFKNLSDPFKVLKGLAQSLRLLRKIKPDIVFSKGGFVSVPVVLAAKLRRIPVIIHESDITPGLANKIAIPAAKKVCCNFPETLRYLPKEKAVLTGSPIRQELLSGDPKKARSFCHMDSQKPVLLVIGGSTGAKAINDAIRSGLTELLKEFQIIHLCGKGKLDSNFLSVKGYAQFEYVSSQLKDLLALADVVVSRAGANAICELLALRKPNILIPLSAQASRGDQILNAKSFQKQGFSYVIEEESLTPESLQNALQAVLREKDSYITAMAKSGQMDSIETIIQLIEHEI